ncbi:hypothetical protein AUJ40_02230 [Candidatus Berkelbacteria bacterium CG1_02_42_45]|uniref:Uncharacterized protein n=5 Tax=Candidatus Berkelbacteria TaxID=1618330 RepID=A0A2M7K0W8_9BACT|nr:MAG: hypothetical protein AUJ40_02230 [Candidatus Berkelbacteria bacterium CG1_02_42_45]PIP50997.1 MAG: hypothetical protein COX11_01015 [Candidatus Berkelbacteria bacterium CG23_combo_of_CG06-09_8_20_14_all_41_73]PIR27444.1 MAG: hypothetical protein COV40_00715 [Candidatus Berkelbacteria bacterium CG11_big_fil_rev_8_21_14_0_20_42_15]PIX29912.1 MAG: hypothetical protein COZ63_02665 [Candidatus Berkelbacteria bacterium CG_4_8_14_3_um_filter_42_13]PIZ27846.1 MAG: hypothetical protein COY45_002
MNQNKSGSLYYLLILVVFAAIFIVAGISFLQTNGKSAKKSPSEDLSNDNQQTQNENDRTSELSADQQFYALGVKDFENKEYEKTVSDLAQAIASNPSVINYYTLKSEAEVLLGRKDDAKATLEAGLKIDPDNELLNSKLNSLISNFDDKN